MEVENLQIDNVDVEILSMLIENAHIPYTEIAKKILVSAGTIHVRMKKLENLGIVKGATLIIDPIRLGFDLTAFLGIYLEKGSIYKDVIKELKQIAEVVEAYYTTGSYSIFAKIICKNTEHLRHVLNDKIQPIDGIQRTETFISLEESIKRNVKLS
jgi:Lrp/AsnC family transcriptional regulator for asnA, asnC and gidA